MYCKMRNSFPVPNIPHLLYFLFDTTKSVALLYIHVSLVMPSLTDYRQIYVKKGLRRWKTRQWCKFANKINASRDHYFCVRTSVWYYWECHSCTSHIWVFTNTWIMDWITQFPFRGLRSSICISLEFRINPLPGQHVTRDKTRDGQGSRFRIPSTDLPSSLLCMGEEAAQLMKYSPSILIQKTRTQV